ncbi:MAG: hypothetical protein CVU43_20980 [Chloroflexi bacterium HGW-Chloroflexi-5]|jgi:hypothetical protein|nr:MAG: hypothetical protein CVU43_20980 [Chloroflexi bacterium HGW-Chloroflexi-5]
MAERRKAKRGKERRKAERLEEEDEITIMVVSCNKFSPKRKLIYTLSMDLSESGARMQVNNFLPFRTLLDIKIASKNPPQTITALGKIKWIKSLFADELFEVGLEFVHVYREAV